MLDVLFSLFSFFLFFYFVEANSSLSNIHSDKTYRIALLGPYTERIRSLFSLINSSSIHLFSPIPLRLSNSVTFKLILLIFTQIFNQENFYYIQTKQFYLQVQKTPTFPFSFLLPYHSFYYLLLRPKTGPRLHSSWFPA